jgi:hypothetical protein
MIGIAVSGKDRSAIGALLVLAIVGSGRIAVASDEGVDGRIEKFCHLLRNDPSFRIRALSAKKLSGFAAEGMRSDRRIVDALTSCLVDDNALVRGICIKGLVKHRAHGSVGRLTYLARFDSEDAVKNAAEDAIAELKRQASLQNNEPEHRPRKGGAVTVSIGRVEVEKSEGLSAPVASFLKDVVRDAVEDQIEPHKPAIFPREDPDLRLDVTVASRITDGSTLQVEVRVILVQLPGAHLRHASRAMARVKNDKRRSKELERDLAVKAASRAVSDALALVYSPKR